MAQPIQSITPFLINTGNARPGYDPKVVGLSNGNILVTWTEPDLGAGSIDAGLGAGTDILGKIIDSRGNVVRDIFAVTSATNLDEQFIKVVATDDGGFVIFYQQDLVGNNWSNEAGTLVWERHDANGDFVTTTSTAIGTFDRQDGYQITPQDVVFNHQTGDSFVQFKTTELTGAYPYNEDLSAKTVSADGTVAHAFATAPNDTAFSVDDINLAILANGNVVSLHNTHTGTMYDAVYHSWFTIYEPDGDVATPLTNVVPGTGTKVASLADGGFVVIHGESFRGVYCQRYDESGQAVGTPTEATGDTSRQVYDTDVIGLPQGGFLVTWRHYTGSVDWMDAQLYGSDGAAVGDVFEWLPADGSPYDLATTPDGRLLFAGKNYDAVKDGDGNELVSAHQIYLTEWDPRGDVIEASDYRGHGLANFAEAEVITARMTGGTINGTATADTLIGLAGVDILNGKGGGDTLKGGNAADKLVGNAGADILFCGNGNDTGFGGNGNDTLKGGNGKDTLNGARGVDALKGQGGNDSLNGGFGQDSLTGGSGADDFVFAAKGFKHADRVTDFRHAADDVLLEDKVFKALHHARDGHLKASEFCLGTSARDGNDHVIYQKSTGKLWYDDDGKGGDGKVLIAEFDDGTALMANDFFVV